MTALPVAFALGVILVTVYRDAVELANHQRQLMESALMASKKAELRSFVRLAQSALSGEDGHIPAQRRARVIDALSRLEFGPDGYFFLYDDKGVNLMHPRQPELVGRNLIGLRDPYGGTPIRELLQASNSGGGFVTYFWQKPSSKRVVRKLGYVEPVPPYNWMLGTGLYLDDIERSLKDIDAQAQSKIRSIMVELVAISVVCILLISGTGLALNLRNHRLATGELRHLARKVVSSQEAERARVARELHDGISQLLVSAKLLLETTMLRADGSPRATIGADSAEPPLGRALDRIHQALREVRQISHDLRPAALDGLGLAAALESMVSEMSKDGGPVIRFSTNSSSTRLAQGSDTALFRICQEAMTNARVHSGASWIAVSLAFARRRVTLTVTDNGRGFDVRHGQRERRSGTGLRNMRERAVAAGGELMVRSRPHQTQIVAVLPIPAVTGMAS